MICSDYTILDQHGMHARPAAAMIKLARQFKSDISLRKDGKTVQMKSMLNILGLALKFGDTVSVIIDGEDEPEAAAAIDHFFSEEIKNF
jgi:phosphocarrier protein HPr